MTKDSWQQCLHLGISARLSSLLRRCQQVCNISRRTLGLCRQVLSPRLMSAQCLSSLDLVSWKAAYVVAT
jgi:hypothetical protein